MATSSWETTCEPPLLFTRPSLLSCIRGLSKNARPVPLHSSGEPGGLIQVCYLGNLMNLSLSVSEKFLGGNAEEGPGKVNEGNLEPRGGLRSKATKTHDNHIRPRAGLGVRPGLEESPPSRVSGEGFHLEDTDPLSQAHLGLPYPPPPPPRHTVVLLLRFYPRRAFGEVCGNSSDRPGHHSVIINQRPVALFLDGKA